MEVSEYMEYKEMSGVRCSADTLGYAGPIALDGNLTQITDASL